MPKVRRKDVPWPVLKHLLDRARDREISTEQIEELYLWLEANPEVPRGRWFKRLSGMIVCGEGELVKTFLRAGQLPTGEEVC